MALELISIKSAREIEAMRRAGRITAQARALAGSMVAQLLKFRKFQRKAKNGTSKITGNKV